jgi:hypothetical protein
MTLAELENRLPPGHIIPAVSIDEHDPPKSVMHEVLGKPDEEVEIHARRRRQRPAKIKMVVRIPQPHQGREQHPFAKSSANPAKDFVEQEAVGEDGEMVAVLLKRRDRDHDRDVLRECAQLGPGEVG